jgi:hypothetical protein
LPIEQRGPPAGRHCKNNGDTRPGGGEGAVRPLAGLRGLRAFRFQLSQSCRTVAELDAPSEIFDELAQRNSLAWRQLAGSHRLHDRGRRLDCIGRRFQARHVEQHRPVFWRRIKPAQAKADRMNISGFGLVDQLADDGVGLAIEHCLGEARRPVARARRPAGWVSALAWCKRHG